MSVPGREGRQPDDTFMNLRKVKVHSTSPSGFWIGCRVLRKFDKKWFPGSVDDITVDEGQQFFHVTFDDFDEKEMDLGEIWDSVIYHPELEVREDDLSPTKFPEVGSVVLFVVEYQPCLGKVVELHPYVLCPIVVEILRSIRSSKDFVSVKFTPSLTDGIPQQLALTRPQVKHDGLGLSETGYLESSVYS